MPKCKICGRPVTTVPVYHPGCLKEWIYTLRDEDRKRLAREVKESFIRKHKESEIDKAIAHFQYGIDHDIFSYPVTTYAKLAVKALQAYKEEAKKE